MQHQRGAIAFVLLVFAASSLPVSVAAEGTHLTVELVELCVPLSSGCVAPHEPCLGLVPPGAYIGLVVRAVRDGAPVAYEEIRLQPDGKVAITGHDGIARFSIAPHVGRADMRVEAPNEPSAPSLEFPLTWTGVTVALRAAPSQPIQSNGADLVYEARLSTTGEPMEGAAILVAGANHSGYQTNPSDASGVATTHVTFHGPVDEQFSVVDVAACGLPLAAAPPPLTLQWVTTASAREPPQISVTSDGWLNSRVVPYSVTGGEAPFRVGWRIGTAAWSDPPIRLNEGAHTIQLRVTDARERTTEISATVKVDVLPPTIGQLANHSDWTQCTTLTWPVTDSASGVDPASIRALDQAQRSLPAKIKDGAITVPIAGGVKSVAVSVSDWAGNRAEREADVRCDEEPPVAVALWAAASWVECSQISWNVRDAASGVASAVATLSSETKIPVSLQGDVAFAAPASGAGVITLTVQDRVGNRASFPSAFQCDSAAPVLSGRIVGTIRAGFLIEDGRLAIDASDRESGIASLVAIVDDGVAVAVDAVSLQGEGVARVRVEATDKLGHLTTISLQQPIDTKAPSILAPSEVCAGCLLRASITEEGSGLAAVSLTLPNGAEIGLPSTGEVAFEVPQNLLDGAPIHLTATDHAGHVTMTAIRVTRPPAEPVIEPDSPGTPPEETQVVEEPAPVVFELRGLVVTPPDAARANDVRVTGIVSGVASGRLVLIDEKGNEHDGGVISLNGTAINAVAVAPGPGDYAVRLDFQTESGERIAHDAGSIHVGGAKVETITSAKISLPAVLLVIGLVTASWLRPRRAR